MQRCEISEEINNSDGKSTEQIHIKMLPLETKNTHKNENLSLGVTETLCLSDLSFANSADVPYHRLKWYSTFKVSRTSSIIPKEIKIKNAL